jgi:hypothetical protein
MLTRDQIVSGLKVRLLADLGLFLEGQKELSKMCGPHDTSIWHAVVAWRCPVRKRRIQGRITPQDLDFVEAVPQKKRTTPSVQLSIPFLD